jgi:hypothetical protein
VIYLNDLCKGMFNKPFILPKVQFENTHEELMK